MKVAAHIWPSSAGNRGLVTAKRGHCGQMGSKFKRVYLVTGPLSPQSVCNE